MDQKTRHKQITLRSYDGENYTVDEGLADLLLALWRGGVVTTFSCEGDDYFKDQTVWSNKPHRAYIQMIRNQASLALVANLVMYYPPISKVGRKVLFDIEFDRHEPHGRGTLPEGRICIRFPHSEISRLTKFLTEPPSEWEQDVRDLRELLKSIPE